MSIKAMNWVWEHSPTSGNERLVLLAIADVADDDGGNAWPAIGRLATKANLNPRTVQRVIARLEADGHLEVDRGGGRYGTHLYRVVIHSPEGVADCHPRQIAGGGDTSATRGVTQLCQGRGDTAAPPKPPVPPVPPPPAREAAPPLAMDNPKGGGGSFDPEPAPGAAADLLPAQRDHDREHVRAFFERLGIGWPISRGQRRRLAGAVTAALAAGWTPDALALHVGANTNGIRNAYAVLSARLRDLPDLPAAALGPRPAWCGQCNQRTRRIEQLDGEDAGRCPACHPLGGDAGAVA